MSKRANSGNGRDLSLDMRFLQEIRAGMKELDAEMDRYDLNPALRAKQKETMEWLEGLIILWSAGTVRQNLRDPAKPRTKRVRRRRHKELV